MDCVSWIYNLGLGLPRYKESDNHGFHRVETSGSVQPTMVPVNPRRHRKHCVVAAMTCNCTVRGSVLRNGLLVYTTRHAKLTLGFASSFLSQH